MAHYPCPNCGGKMFIEEMHEGFVVPCPHCQDTFRVPRGAAGSDGAGKPIRPPVVHDRGTLPGVEGIGVRSESGEQDAPPLPPATRSAIGGPLATEPEDDEGEDDQRELGDGREDSGGREYSGGQEYEGGREYDGTVEEDEAETARTTGTGGFGGAIVSSRAGPFAQSPPRPRIPEPRAHGALGAGEGSSDAVWILVLGIMGLMGCWITSPIAVVMGHKHKDAARRAGREPDSLAVAGYVLGWVGSGLIGLGLLCGLPLWLLAAMGG